MSETMGWAIKSDVTNQLDGHRVHFEGGARFERPPQFGGYTTMIFKTRQAAREFIKEHYSYIAKRSDLRREPHCWRVPKAVRVTITVVEGCRVI